MVCQRLVCKCGVEVLILIPYPWVTQVQWVDAGHVAVTI